MNLYKYHNEPKELLNHSDELFKKVEQQTQLNKFWKRYFPHFVDKDTDFLTSNAETSFVYAHSELNDTRFESGEDAIATDAEYSYKYANHVLEGAFPKGEAIMAKDNIYAYMYAAFLGKPFPEGEEAIAFHSTYAYNYAINILNARFPKGEATIKKDVERWDKYAEYFDLL